MADIINPKDWPRPKGYSNGILAPAGARLLFVAGQVGWDEHGKFASSDFAPQFEKALKNALAVVAAAGGKPEHVVRITIYVTDKQEYRAALKPVGETFRRLMQCHYPAMTLVEVAALLEDEARIEIELTAAIPA